MAALHTDTLLASDETELVAIGWDLEKVLEPRTVENTESCYTSSYIRTQVPLYLIEAHALI